MLPDLKELMELELPVEKTVEVIPEPGQETEQESEQEPVKETIIVDEPAFDPVEDAELIAVVDALHAQYMSDSQNPGLTLLKRAEEYRTHSKECIQYTLDHGETLPYLS